MNEKKISIMEVADPCADCNVPGLDCGLCGLRICFNRLPTREQVVEKMAKAIYKEMCPSFSQMFTGWRAYIKIAEAVLNANIILSYKDETNASK